MRSHTLIYYQCKISGYMAFLENNCPQQQHSGYENSQKLRMMARLKLSPSIGFLLQLKRGLNAKQHNQGLTPFLALNRALLSPLLGLKSLPEHLNSSDCTYRTQQTNCYGAYCKMVFNSKLIRKGQHLHISTNFAHND